jgi:hypothetical protein
MSLLDNLADLGKTVANFAPALGKVLPIPGGEILGEVIAAEFGGDISKVDDLVKRIHQDPESEAKLLSIQTNYNLEINKLRLGFYIEANKSKDSARIREVDLAKTGRSDYTQRNLAYMTCAGFMAAIFLIPYMKIDGNEREIVLVLFGMLAGKYGSIIDYYFGSAVDYAMSSVREFRDKKKGVIDEQEDLPVPFSGQS